MADLVIRGMDMPEYCYECPCYNGESGYCQAYKSGYLYSIERPAKCPLLTLPAGHGRLIDADVMAAGLMKCAKNPPDDDQESRWFYLFAAEIAKSCQTIVPAEGGTDNDSEL